MGNWEDLKSSKALVCKREINCDQGGATVYMVLLADGFLLDCGAGGYAERRAIDLARTINSAEPELFNYNGRKTK